MNAWLPTLEPQTEHLPMYERLLRSLVSDIEGGALGDGSPLPPQRKLASSLGLSVGTVTRFYREAESLGLVAGHVGRGTRVTSSPDQSVRSLHARLSPGQEQEATFQPQMANLARNEPSPELAARAIEDALAIPDFARLMREETGYAAPAGHPSHRQLFASWLGRNGLAVAWRDVLVCPGAHHALGIAIRATRKSGETVLVDNNSYFGFLSLARSHGMNVVPVGMDEHGPIPSELDSAAREHPEAVFYTMPNLHNPTSRTTPEERRHEVVQIARRHNMRLIEDDVYRSLTPSPPPAYLELAPERTLYINSLSKTVAPSLRAGCLVVNNKDLFGDVMRIAQAESLAAASISTTIAAIMLKYKIVDAARDRLVKDTAQRLDIVREVFADDVRYEWSPGAHHIWLPMSLAEAERVNVDAMQSSIALTPPSSSSLVPSDSGLRLCIGACQKHALPASLSTLKTLLY